MARPRRSQANRERLLEEGVAAFLEQGYHGTGIKDVLDRVAVPKGSFYNYFASKEAFGAEVIRHYAEEFNGELDDAVAGGDPIAGIKRIYRGIIREQEESGFTGGCLVANLGAEIEDSEMCREALAEAVRGWRERLRDAIGAAQEQGTVRDDIAAAELAGVLHDAWEGALIRSKIERSSRPMRQCVRRLIDDYFRP